MRACGKEGQRGGGRREGAIGCGRGWGEAEQKEGKAKGRGIARI